MRQKLRSVIDGSCLRSLATHTQLNNSAQYWPLRPTSPLDLCIRLDNVMIYTELSRIFAHLATSFWKLLQQIGVWSRTHVRHVCLFELRDVGRINVLYSMRRVTRPNIEIPNAHHFSACRYFVSSVEAVRFFKFQRFALGVKHESSFYNSLASIESHFSTLSTSSLHWLWNMLERKSQKSSNLSVHSAYGSTLHDVPTPQLISHPTHQLPHQLQRMTPGRSLLIIANNTLTLAGALAQQELNILRINISAIAQQ